MNRDETLRHYNIIIPCWFEIIILVFAIVLPIRKVLSGTLNIALFLFRLRFEKISLRLMFLHHFHLNLKYL